MSLAEDTWSQISQPDGLVSELQISSPGQANANQLGGRGGDVITKPAFFPSSVDVHLRLSWCSFREDQDAKRTSVQPRRQKKTSSHRGHHRFMVLMDRLDTNFLGGKRNKVKGLLRC